MSTIKIFKSYEQTFDNGLDEFIESFDNFVGKVEDVYRAHDMSFEFHEYSEYRSEWWRDDTIYFPTFPRDGYFRIMGKFELVLGIYANMTAEWSRQEMDIFREYIKEYGRKINLCTMFLSDEKITPEVVEIKRELAAELGDNYIDSTTYGELQFNFLLQLRGTCNYDDTRMIVDGSYVKFGSLYVCHISEITYLKDNEDRAQQIIDALSFAMALRYNSDTSNLGCQMVKLLKSNKNEGIAKLLDYENLKAQITEQVEIYSICSYSTYHDNIRLLLDKLKLLALNALILEGDTAEGRRLNRKYYKQRYDVAVKCSLPIWITAPVLLDYIALLKDEKRKIALMEECVARQLATKKNPGLRAWEERKIIHYLDSFHNKLIAHYERERNFDKVEQLCLSEIERERNDGYGIFYSRPKALYSKLGAIYEAKLTGKECVL